MAISFSDVHARDGGALEFRLVFEGAKYEFVTSLDMVGACVESGQDGVTRVPGLDRTSIGFTEQVNLAEARIRISISALRITDGTLGWPDAATGIFSPLEGQRRLTWLTAESDAADLTLDVADAAGISDGDYLHVGTEVVRVNGAPAGNVVTVIRGKWRTTAQRHPVSTRTGDAYAQAVYSTTPAWQRRRFWVYAHTKDELSTSSTGTLIYRGLITSDPSESGGVWTIGAESRWSLLDASVGFDEEPIAIRGIYYPARAPLVLDFNRRSGTTSDSTWGTTVRLVLSGFWETQEEFCEALTTAINADSTISTWSTPFTAVPTPNGWELVYETPSVSPRFISVMTPIHSGSAAVDGAMNGGITGVADLEELEGGAVEGRDRPYIGVTVQASTVYLCLWSTDVARVPREDCRAVPRRTGTNTSALFDTPNLATYPLGRIYLSSTAGISTSDTLSIQGIAEDAEPFVVSVDAVSTSSGYVDVLPAELATLASTAFTGAGATVPAITATDYFGDAVAGIALDDFIEAIQSAAPASANLGEGPWILSDDVADWTAVVDAVAGSRSYLTNRAYVFRKRHRLDEVLREEAKLYGLFFYLDADSKIAVRRLTVETAEVASGRTVESDTSSRVLDAELDEVDFAGEGVINVVKVERGYDFAEDKYTLPAVYTEKVASISLLKRRMELAVSPKVRPVGDEIPPTGAFMSIGRQIVSLFGGRTVHVTVAVPLSFWPVLCGDSVILTLDELPLNGARALRSPGNGMTNIRGIVVARTWNLGDDPAGQFTIMLTGLDVAGYSPAGRVASASGASTTWTLTLTANHYAPSGAIDASYFRVGDLVELREFDSDSPTEAFGTITSIVGNDVGVELDDVWAGLGGATYDLHYYTTTSWQSSQRIYCAIADSGRVIDYGGGTTAAARVFAP